jgi:hypothetical protein
VSKRMGFVHRYGYGASRWLYGNIAYCCDGMLRCGEALRAVPVQGEYLWCCGVVVLPGYLRTINVTQL